MSRRKKYWFALLTFVLLLVIAETASQAYISVAGYQIGSLAPNWQVVNDVKKYAGSRSYYTDSTGIFKADTFYWKSQHVWVDQNGFRGDMGIEKDTVYPSLLLIGDSFTWGAQATDLDKSFANILARTTQYQVYNTGIPGADPAQYALIADSFIPRIKPAITVVMLYMGNDMMDEYRQPKPYNPLYYVTNQGWLPGYYNGQYFPSADSSFNYYQQLYSPKTTIEKWIAKTAFGTLLLSLPVRLHERAQWGRRKQLTVTNTYLRHIADTCTKYQSKLMMFVIPYSGKDLGRDYATNPKQYLLNEYPKVFSGLEIITYALPMEKEDYLPLPNGHFNDRGHARAAAYMKQVLTTSVYP